MKPYYENEMQVFYYGDARDVLPQLSEHSVDMCITSPPYYGLRRYHGEPVIWDAVNGCVHEWGVAIINPKADYRTPEQKIAQGATAGNSISSINFATGDLGNFCRLCGAWRGMLGLEPTPELYISHLCGIFDLAKRVLKKTGTLWVNLDDSYAGSGSGGGGDYIAKIGFSNRPTTNLISVPAKSLIGIPARFQLEMMARGWILRNVIIWAKNNPMPESVKDRFTNDWEHVFFFSQQGDYFFKQQFEVMDGESGWAKQRAGGKDTGHYKTGCQWAKPNNEVNPLGRNKRTTWHINTKPYSSWQKSDHLRRVGWDVVSDGMMHIMSPNCPEHEDLLARVASGVCGECEADGLTRIKRIDACLVQEQVTDFYTTVKPIFCYSWEHNSGYARLQYLLSAMPHNSENRKRGPSLLTILPYSSFLKILSRIDDKQDALLLFVLYHGMTGNKISLGAEDVHLLDKMPTRIVDKSLYSISHSCLCSFYHKITEKTSHFATFPPELVRTPILAGCPLYICSKCGKPKMKMYDTKSTTRERLAKGADNSGGGSPERLAHGQVNIHGKGMTHDLDPERSFIGYSDCKCGEPFVPGVVMDIFAGSGTVLQVALDLARRSIGIDASIKYCKLALKRPAQKGMGL